MCSQWSTLNCLIDYETVSFATYPRYSNVHVAGLALPPAGVIDSSLLVAYGETLTFAGSLIGIDYHYRYRQKK